MRYLKTSEAAALLNVSPNTLRAWERRFGYPRPHRSPGRHRLYAYAEVAGLRDALQEGLSISSAVSGAREGLSADSGSLVGALGSFDVQRADHAIEAVLALRSLERTVNEVLLPSLDEVARRHGTDSAPWAFAAQWGTSWLRRARRLAPAPTRPFSVLVGDSCRDDLDTDAPHMRALELLVARAGVNVLSLSVRGLTGMTEALSSRPLNAVVLAGGHYSDDAVARWAYAVRTAVGPQPVLIYRRGAARLRVRTAGGGGVLPLAAGEAAQMLIERLHESASGPGSPVERRRRRAAS